MASYFYWTYDECRERFLGLAHGVGARVERHPIEARGPEGQRLTLDVARLGAADARRALVLSSGTHGIEGFAGSAIQQRFLTEQAPSLALPGDVALLLIHAVNPYGFAWWRRANESNVDLNRNFLDFDAPLPEAPDYESLHALLCPERIDEESERHFAAEAARLLQEKGLPWLANAISSGQYSRPLGLYYGGAKREASAVHIEELARRHLTGADEVLWIDLHTGLGEFGSYTLLSNHAGSSPEHAWLASHFDPSRLEVTLDNEDRVTPHKLGQMATGVARVLPGTRLRAMTFEVGTHDETRILMAERRENWLHHFGDRDSAVGREILWEHREGSCPDSDAWRERALENGALVVSQALSALTTPSETAGIGPDDRAVRGGGIP